MGTLTPREARTLLGGYATGTLDASERKALFTAALADQALFDALMEEEALRELLADPAHRARLLAALGQPARPFWRRPATLSLAASLLAAVGIGVVVHRVPVPVPAPAPQERLTQEEAKPALPGPKEAADRSVTEPPRVTTPHQAKRAPAPPASPSPAPPPPEPARKEESAGAGAATQGAPAEVEIYRDNAAAGVSLAPAPPPKPEARFKVSSLDSAATPPVTWQVEPVAAGRVEVRVQASAEGHLYLLRRHGTSPMLLVATRTTALPAGGSARLFASALDPGDALDLYWMAQPVAAPLALPAEGPVAGFRARIWPAAPARP